MNSKSETGRELRLERRGHAGIITLDRPAALNALTHAMVRDIDAALDDWETDPAVRVILIRGEGRAFSAGGDLAHIHRATAAGQPPLDFFADEYRLNARIKACTKPYVALVDGIVMGGGVGVSVHGSHRIFTEKARLAMPEVSIGFFPDVGGSQFLPRLPQRFGYFLGLTGARIGWGDALHAGIATDCVDSDALEALAGEICDSGDIERSLAGRRRFPPPETQAGIWAGIETAFAAGSVIEILARLEASGGEWASRAAASMRRNAPTSLHVTLRQLTAGAGMSMDECMRMEYRIVSRLLAGHDFPEGIRATIIDKDGAPRWQPARLEDVDVASIDAIFAALPGGELQFARGRPDDR